MICRLIQTEIRNIFHNLALEHAVIQHAADRKKGSALILWQNHPAVVVGRGQDLKNEVNLQYCNENGIEVARRISGGGAVYHDLGNLNISFIISPKLKKILKVKDLPSVTEKISNLLIHSLKLTGYHEIRLEGGSNILYQDMKISGSAGYIYKGWNLHHATLLISANLSHLNNALLARDKNPSDKRRSRYFETTNLPSFNKVDWLGSFISILKKDYHLDVVEDTLTDHEKELSDQLHKEIYAIPRWIENGRRREN